jgi:hypothetical protein
MTVGGNGKMVTRQIPKERKTKFQNLSLRGAKVKALELSRKNGYLRKDVYTRV